MERKEKHYCHFLYRSVFLQKKIGIFSFLFTFSHRNLRRERGRENLYIAKYLWGILIIIIFLKKKDSSFDHGFWWQFFRSFIHSFVVRCLFFGFFFRCWSLYYLYIAIWLCSNWNIYAWVVGWSVGSLLYT